MVRSSSRKKVGFYAGCDTPEKRRRRREGNTESVRRHRMKKKNRIGKNLRCLKQLQDFQSMNDWCIEVESDGTNSWGSLGIENFTINDLEGMLSGVQDFDVAELFSFNALEYTPKAF